MIGISDSESNVIDLTGSGNTLSILIVDQNDLDENSFIHDGDHELVEQNGKSSSVF